MSRQRYVPTPPRGRIVNALPQPLTRALPVFVRARGRGHLPAVRRSTIFEWIPSQSSLPLWMSTKRPAALRMRRGAITSPPVKRVPPRVIPVVLLRRPTIATPRQRVRTISVLKVFVPPGFQTPPPTVIGRRAYQLPPVRRGLFTPYVYPGGKHFVPSLVPIVIARHTLSLKPRRGAILNVRGIFVPPGPGPLAPQFLRHVLLENRGVRPRRGSLLQPPWPSLKKPVPPPPVPPSPAGGSVGLSLGRRFQRARRKPVKSSFDKTLVWRQ